MIASKFAIGQQVRHRLSGTLGVVIDVDPEYSLDTPKPEEIYSNESLQQLPWYHVVMEDDNGEPVHTYIAEIQLSGEIAGEHPDQPSMDELAASVRRQIQAPGLRH